MHFDKCEYPTGDLVDLFLHPTWVFADRKSIFWKGLSPFSWIFSPEPDWNDEFLLLLRAYLQFWRMWCSDTVGFSRFPLRTGLILQSGLAGGGLQLPSFNSFRFCFRSVLSHQTQMVAGVKGFLFGLQPARTQNEEPGSARPLLPSNETSWKGKVAGIPVLLRAHDCVQGFPQVDAD